VDKVKDDFESLNVIDRDRHSTDYSHYFETIQKTLSDILETLKKVTNSFNHNKEEQ